MLSRKQFLQAFTLASFALLCVSGRPTPAVTKASRYRLVELPPLPGCKESFARAISDQGVIVGTSDLKATCWKDGKPVELPNWGKESQAVAINNNDQIVGGAMTADGQYHAVLWEGNKILDLGTLGGSNSFAARINNRGLIVGNSEYKENDHDRYACCWKKGRISKLPTPWGLTSQADGVNDKEEVVGYADVALEKPLRAVIWTRSRLCGLLGGAEARLAYGINNSGAVVGCVYVSSADKEKPMPFLTSKGNFQILNVPQAKISFFPTAISDNGIILMTGTDPIIAEDTGFLYLSGRLYNLNSLVSQKNGLRITHAEGINSKGYIVGAGVRDNTRRAVMLIPLPAQ